MRMTVVLAVLILLLPITVQAGEAEQPFSSWLHVLEDIWEAVWDAFNFGTGGNASPNIIPVGLTAEPDDIQFVSGNANPNIVPVGLSDGSSETASSEAPVPASNDRRRLPKTD